MKTIILTFLIIILSKNTLAALPPKYQNLKDLDVMVNFIKQHDKVMSSLTSIDLKKYTVYFGNNCKAQFGRSVITRAPGWVGPASALVFIESTCSLN